MGEQIIDISSLLKIIGTELTALSGVAEDLQPVLSSAYAVVGPCSTMSVKIQSCDALTQKLYEIARVLHIMASIAPVNWKVDVTALTRDVRLSELINMLLGYVVVNQPISSGEVQMF